MTWLTGSTDMDTGPDAGPPAAGDDGPPRPSDPGVASASGRVIGFFQMLLGGFSGGLVGLV